MIRKYFSKKSDLKKSDLKTVIKFFVHRDMDILMRLDEENKYLITISSHQFIIDLLHAHKI